MTQQTTTPININIFVYEKKRSRKDKVFSSSPALFHLSTSHRPPPIFSDTASSTSARTKECGRERTEHVFNLALHRSTTITMSFVLFTPVHSYVQEQRLEAVTFRWGNQYILLSHRSTYCAALCPPHGRK
mmetsp:Transcript_24489/g.44182  ORF Transcript_24489/g.44182 Transcript_24489/m.44182 type:complete len:130 (-) Transcript_24489:620-1009(-)